MRYLCDLHLVGTFCLVEDFQAHQYIGLCEYGVKGSMMIKSNIRGQLENLAMVIL